MKIGPLLAEDIVKIKVTHVFETRWYISYSLHTKSYSTQAYVLFEIVPEFTYSLIIYFTR